MQWIRLGLAVALLTGCVATNKTTSYVQTSGSASISSQLIVLGECRLMAAKVVRGGGLLGVMALASRQAEVLDACMASKGYSNR